MNGPQNYLEAEYGLLKVAELEQTTDMTPAERLALYVAEAQVHATLALVAVMVKNDTGLSSAGNGHTWREVFPS